jgi:hypothetical protein
VFTAPFGSIFTPVLMVGPPVSHLDSNITSYKHLPET